MHSYRMPSASWNRPGSHGGHRFQTEGAAFPPPLTFPEVFQQGFDLGWAKAFQFQERKAPRRNDGKAPESPTQILYEAANCNEKPLFMVSTGNGGHKVYPQKIQEELREMWRTLHEEGAKSKDMKFKLAANWIMNLRLFDEEEKTTWKDHLAEFHPDGYVGVQWNALKAKCDPPEIDPNITYRPIFIQNS